MSDTKEYTVRVQGDRAYTYGLGEVIVPGVALFTEQPKHYNLSKEELNVELKRLRKVTIQ